MKVLFVCHQNVGRSQMAKAFYNQLTKTQDADAAGTQMDVAGQTLADRKKNSASKNFFILDVMNDVGIDISQFTRRQLVKSDVQKYDLIVSMAPPDDTPSWLLNATNYLFWPVPDPRGQNRKVTARVRDEIEAHVEQLIHEFV